MAVEKRQRIRIDDCKAAMRRPVSVAMRRPARRSLIHAKQIGALAEVTLIRLLDRLCLSPVLYPDPSFELERRSVMNRFYLKSMGLFAAGLILAAAPLVSARAAYRCDVPRVGGEARACAAAAQGPTELRRFVERTRAIYRFYYWDYAPHAQAAAAAAPASDAAKLASAVTEIRNAAATK